MVIIGLSHIVLFVYTMYQASLPMLQHKKSFDTCCVDRSNIKRSSAGLRYFSFRLCETRHYKK